MVQNAVQFIFIIQHRRLCSVPAKSLMMDTASSCLRSHLIKQMSFTEALFCLLSSRCRACKSVSSCPMLKNDLNSLKSIKSSLMSLFKKERKKF